MKYLARAENIAWWSVLLTVFLLPWFFIPNNWMTIGASKMLLVVSLVTVATLSSVLASLNQWTLRIPKSSLLLAAALVPLAYLVSALATGVSRESLIGSAEQDTFGVVALLYALFFVSANALASTTGRVVLALRALLLGGGVLLVIQVLHLLVPSLTLGGALVGNTASVIGTWHDFAIGAGFLFFLSLALLPTRIGEGRFRAVLCTIAGVSFVMLVIANSSDVWVALAALALFYAAYLWHVSRKAVSAHGEHRRRTLMWLALALVAGGLYFVAPAIQGALPEQLRVSQLEVRPSWKGTFAVGAQVFSRPGSVFFGSGPNTFPRQWGLYKPVSVNQTQFWNTDFYSGVGLIPTSVVTVGILGLIAWGAVLLALVAAVRRTFMAEAQHAGAKAMRAAVCGGACYLTTLSVLYVPGPALSALTFLMFAFLVADELLSRTVKDMVFSLSLATWKGRLYSVLLCIFAFAILVIGVQTLRAVLSDSLVNRAAALYSSSQDLSAASTYISEALAIEPRNDRAHRAAVELGMVQLKKLAAANDPSDAARQQLQQTLARTIDHGLTAITIESRNYQNWLELAYLYGQLAGVGVEGADASARSAYAEVQKNNPTTPLPALGLAQLDLLQHNDKAASDHLKAALALKPDLPAAYYLLSQIEARAQNLPAAAKDATQAAQLSPQDPLGWYNLGTVLYAQQDWQNASLALERAVGLQSNYANALFLLGLSYYKLGRSADALREFEAVAVLNTSDASLANIVSHMREGKDPFATEPAPAPQLTPAK